MLRYDMGEQQKAICLTDNRLTKQGMNLNNVKTGIPIECVPTTTGYKEIQNTSQYITNNIPPTIFYPTQKASNCLLDNVKCEDIKKMKQSWRLGKAWRIGTDGGLKYNIGTIGVTITEQDTEEELMTI